MGLKPKDIPFYESLGITFFEALFEFIISKINLFYCIKPFVISMSTIIKSKIFRQNSKYNKSERAWLNEPSVYEDFMLEII